MKYSTFFSLLLSAAALVPHALFAQSWFDLRPEEIRERINQKIEKRELKNRGGEGVVEKIESGLVRADKRYLYAVRGDIPVMLIDEAIPLAGIL